MFYVVKAIFMHGKTQFVGLHGDSNMLKPIYELPFSAKVALQMKNSSTDGDGLWT